MKITVAMNTWRLGVLDATISALEAQEMPDGVALDVDVELVIADDLHRWRAEAVRGRLARCPFTVKHLPVERSLFPVCSTMRAGNTCIKAADPTSELLVHVCDGAVPPPHFLAEHWLAYQRDSKAFGIAPYHIRHVKPGAWTLPVMDAWEMIESLVAHEASGNGNSGDAWTGWKGRDRWTRSSLLLDAVCEPFDAVNGQASPAAAATGAKPGDVVTEWFAHYKCDAVPLAAYRAVNGWDEEYDGGYVYADIDMSLRLMAAGYTPRVIGYGTPVDVPIISPHFITKRGDSGWTAPRIHHNAPRLARLVETLRDDETKFRCEEGLERPIHTIALDGKLFVGGTTRLTLQRPWLSPRYEAGRLDLVVTPGDAWIWARIAPPTEWKPFKRAVGNNVDATGPGSVVLPPNDPEAQGKAASRAPTGARLICVDTEAGVNALISFFNNNGWPCHAEEIEEGLCGVMAVKR